MPLVVLFPRFDIFSSQPNQVYAFSSYFYKNCYFFRAKQLSKFMTFVIIFLRFDMLSLDNLSDVMPILIIAHFCSLLAEDLQDAFYDCSNPTREFTS